LELKNNNTIQVFWVAIGSLVAFSFSIISAAILSRYLSKDDYGTYRQILYVYNSLLVIFSVGLPKAFAYFLPLVDIKEGKNLISKLTIIFLLMGCVFSLLLFFGSPIIANVLMYPDLKRGLRLFSPVPMFLLPTMGIEGIYSTLKRTYIIAIYTVVTRIGMLLLIALPVIFISNHYNVAIIGFVVSSFLSFLLALYLKYKPFVKVKSIKTKVTYKEIFEFSLPLMYASIWGIGITSADQFFISRYFGKSIFAEFANGSLQLPFVIMISGATSTVLQPVLAKMINNGQPSADIVQIWITAVKKSVIIIYPLVLFFWAFAYDVMILIYGNSYANSASYFRIMSLYNFFNIIIFAPAILAFGATKFYSKVHFFIALLIWLFQYLSVKLFHNPYLISAVSVVCRSSIILILSNFVSKKLKVGFLKLYPIRIMLKVLINCGIIIIFIKYLFLIFPISNNHFIVISVSFAIYCCLLLASMKFFNINYLNVFRPLFLRFRK
jgi:O-antigen/teichoic acid export membrane protein